MPRDLLDLLWRDHPAAPRPGRGPRAKVATSDAVDAAVAIADADGLEALTVRRLAERLGIAPNAVYTHVGSRTDLLVLMADAVRLRHPAPTPVAGTWQQRVRAVAEAELALLTRHAWLLDVRDTRTAFGPGTIATYEAQLHAFDGTALDDVTRDAALTFVVDFVRAAARAGRPDPGDSAASDVWATWSGRLAAYLGDDAPLARRVGAAAGAALDGPYDARHAWRFGLERVLDALEALVGPGTSPD